MKRKIGQREREADARSKGYLDQTNETIRRLICCCVYKNKWYETTTEEDSKI